MSMQIKASRALAQGSGRVMPGVGDPGLFSFIGKAIKTGIGFAAGGGIAGALARRIFKPSVPTVATGPTIVNGQMDTSRFPGLFPQTPLQQQVPTPGVGGFVERLVPGGESGFMAAPVMGGCPTGFHPNKSDYFTKSGGFIQKGTRCVRNRRRNPLNARAADRAISRIESAKRATKRLGRVTIKKKC